MKPLESLVATGRLGLKVVLNMGVGASDGVFTSAAGPDLAVSPREA